jgi:ATP-dependent helicase/DNAse subunit B
MAPPNATLEGGARAVYSVPEMAQLFVHPQGTARLARMREWLGTCGRSERVLLIAPTLDAANALARGALGEICFGWERTTPSLLAARLALREMAARASVPVTPLALEAICARAIARLKETDELGRYAELADQPGLGRALASTYREVSNECVAIADLEARAPELARMIRMVEAELAAAHLVDRASIWRMAASALERGVERSRCAILDAAVESRSEERFFRALVRASGGVCVTLPAADRRAIALFEDVLQARAARDDVPRARALDRLAAQLFAPTTEVAPADESVELLSAPGESREAVEIARRIVAEAARGRAFDRMAVLLRGPDHYRVHLAEAFARAGIAAHFTKGTTRPNRNGRALLALLRCKRENLSAKAFAEYLSLGVVPVRPSRAVALPEDPIVPLPALDEDVEQPSEDEPRFAVPRRAERLLVDAAVIGGRARWRRRLDGLRAEKERQLEVELEPVRRESIERQLRELAGLSELAFPILERLEELPESARFGTWIERLKELASIALRDAAPVLSVLAELEVMENLGPVDLGDVERILTPRLTDLYSDPTTAPAGKVFVGSVDEARGRVFELVFVPGLAEKMFPRKVLEDPLLLDVHRAAIDPALSTNNRRIEAERLALATAVGAATDRVVLSYPRVDVDRARPRVPSFYVLEAVRAIEGVLPTFDALEERAAERSEARLGWPAPTDPRRAIDDAEYDLATLTDLFDANDERARGAARYLIDVNPHLARALRFRAERWATRPWKPTDGFVSPNAPARAALARHLRDRRAYSPTALEAYAACPYRFFLRALVGLSPLPEASAIEEVDPRTRGEIVHEAQFEILRALQSEGLLPVTRDTRPRALDVLARAFEDVRDRAHDELAPAIVRTFEDAMLEIAGDLREWLRRMAEHPEWLPLHFELAFGLSDRQGRDRASTTEDVPLDAGIRLRGSIDLVEARDGRIRATDYKTGAAPEDPGVISGGRSLQALFYALALEKLFPERAVTSGRLFYCTSRGAFAEHEVPLDRSTKSVAGFVVNTVMGAVESGFLPAAPLEGECGRCDYLPICGPHELRRSRRKDPEKLGPLVALRRER